MNNFKQILFKRLWLWLLFISVALPLTVVEAPSGISEDLLNRARQPVLEWMQMAPQSNNFWLDLASIAQSQPERFATFNQRLALVQQITPAELSQLAQKYLKDDTRLTIETLPAPVTAP